MDKSDGKEVYLFAREPREGHEREDSSHGDDDNVGGPSATLRTDLRTHGTKVVVLLLIPVVGHCGRK